MCIRGIVLFCSVLFLSLRKKYESIKKDASVLIAGLVVASCANDLDGFISIPDDATGVQQISTRSSSDNLRIVYHGKVYETLYTIIDDSIYSYQNSEVKDLMDNLSETRPNLRHLFMGMESLNILMMKMILI